MPDCFCSISRSAAARSWVKSVEFMLFSGLAMSRARPMVSRRLSIISTWPAYFWFHSTPQVCTSASSTSLVLYRMPRVPHI